MISRIRFDRLLITILIIFTICTFISWIFNHYLIYNNTATSQSMEINNMEYNIISPQTKLNFTEPNNVVIDTSILDTSNNLEEYEEVDYNLGEDYTIENFGIIYQMPELPTGCEITALTMMLNYYNFEINKTEMAKKYLPTIEYDFYYDNGIMIGNDIDCYFIGNPESESGFVCGCQAIETAANKYFDDIDSNYVAVDLTGSSPYELYDLISKDTPVFVLVTIGMEDRFETEGWYTEDGKYVEWSTNDHGAVLIGYSDETVTIADPLAGIIEYERDQFEKVYIERGQKCVIIQNR